MSGSRELVLGIAAISILCLRTKIPSHNDSSQVQDKRSTFRLLLLEALDTVDATACSML